MHRYRLALGADLDFATGRDTHLELDRSAGHRWAAGWLDHVDDQ
jgi:hypothetical protein